MEETLRNTEEVAQDILEKGKAVTARDVKSVMLTTSLTLLLAITCGVTAANLYYNQPLLAAISRSFHVSETVVGTVPTMTQLGYATGILLFIPLGDRLRRKPLVLGLIALIIFSLLAAATARNLAVLAVASFTVGLVTVVPHVLIPFVASIVTPMERGQAVGKVMSGLLLGILLSRTVSGIVGNIYGWRAVFYAAMILMLLLGVVLAVLLPDSRGTATLSYPQLLKSVWNLVITEPVLRQACVSGALLFASFSIFWATLAYLMTSPAYHQGPLAVGLFGLVGAAGAMGAPLAGRLADLKGPRYMVGISVVVVAVSFGFFLLFGLTYTGLIAGVLVMDLGVQAGHVSNQTRIYTLGEHHGSRLNTAYMVSYFLGGAAGSQIGAWAWASDGWRGVSIAGIATMALAMLIHNTARA